MCLDLNTLDGKSCKQVRLTFDWYTCSIPIMSFSWGTCDLAVYAFDGHYNNMLLGRLHRSICAVSRVDWIRMQVYFGSQSPKWQDEYIHQAHLSLDLSHLHFIASSYHNIPSLDMQQGNKGIPQHIHLLFADKMVHCLSYLMTLYSQLWNCRDSKLASG